MSAQTRNPPASHRTRRGLIGLALALVAGLPLLLAAGGSGGRDDAEEHPGPREIYNEGTRRLREGKLNEAEAILQSAVASQNPVVQPLALYNLGQVRFQQGMQEYTNAPDGRAVAAASARATRRAGDAIQAADDALANEEIQSIVTAYVRGRGARKELKGAIEAVKHALDAYGTVLAKWRRASGDFRSTMELRPSDADAQTNAAVVDYWIAEVVDRQQMMMQGQRDMQSKLGDLAKKLQQLSQKQPDSDDQSKGGQQQKAAGGDDDQPGSKSKSGQNGENGLEKNGQAGQSMMPGREGMESVLRQLNDRLAQLKQKIPADMLEQMKQNGDDGDDDDDQPQPQKLKEGQEGQGSSGKQMLLTREEAERLLQLLRDPNRKLSLSGLPEANQNTEQEGVAAKERRTRDW